MVSERDALSCPGLAVYYTLTARCQSNLMTLAMRLSGGRGTAVTAL